MRIYQTDDPMQALWEIVSPLASEIKTYKQVMDEDEDSVPEIFFCVRRSRMPLRFTATGTRNYGNAPAI